MAPRVFFENLLERLNQLSNFVPRIIVIGPFPESPYWGPNLGRNYLQSHRSFDNSLSSFEDLQRDLLNFLSMISNENSKIDVIYPHLFLSENNSSLVNRVIDGNSNQFLPFYYDDDHVNGFGSEPIIGKFMELLE